MIEVLVVLGVIGVLGTGMVGAMIPGPGDRWRTDETLLLVLAHVVGRGADGTKHGLDGRRFGGGTTNGGSREGRETE